MHIYRWGLWDLLPHISWPCRCASRLLTSHCRHSPRFDTMRGPVGTCNGNININSSYLFKCYACERFACNQSPWSVYAHQEDIYILQDKCACAYMQFDCEDLMLTLMNKSPTLPLWVCRSTSNLTHGRATLKSTMGKLYIWSTSSQRH